MILSMSPQQSYNQDYLQDKTPLIFTNGSDSETSTSSEVEVSYDAIVGSDTFSQLEVVVGSFDENDESKLLPDIRTLIRHTIRPNSIYMTGTSFVVFEYGLITEPFDSTIPDTSSLVMTPLKGFELFQDDDEGTEFSVQRLLGSVSLEAPVVYGVYVNRGAVPYDNVSTGSFLDEISFASIE